MMLLPGHEHHVLLLHLLLLLRLLPQTGLVESWNRDAPSALPKPRVSKTELRGVA
jgi:hypothetical protein